MAITAKFDADFSDFHKETQKATGGLTDFEKAASNVARSIQSDLLAMFSVGMAVDFINDTVAAAGALKVLSQQTQISTDDLQLMAGAMSEFGVSQDELGRALGTLSKKIAGGDDSVAGALAQMGLSLKDLEGKSGADLFLTIERALGTLKGSLRDTAAAALFGDKLGAAMAGASEGIDGAMDRARELNTVMSVEAINALDEYNTAMGRAKTNMQNLLAEGLGPLAQGFNTLIDAQQRGISKWDLFMGVLPKLPGLNTGVTRLADAIDKLNQKTEAQGTTAAASARTMTVALTDEQKAVQFLRILQENASKELSAAQITHLQELDAIGQLTAANAAGVGVNAAEYKKYIQMVKDADAAARASADANALMVKEQEKLTEMKFQRELALHKLLQAELATTTAARLAHVNAGILKEFDAQVALNKAQGLDAVGAVQIAESAMTTYAAKMQELNIIKATGENTTKREALAAYELQQGLLAEARATDQVVASTGKLPAATGAATTGIGVMATEAERAAKIFETLKGTIDNAAQVAANMAKRDALKPLMPGMGGVIPGGTGAGTSGYFGANTAQYGAGGFIGVGTPPVTVNINGSVLSNPNEIARVVGGAVTSSYRSGGNRLPV